MASPIFVVKSNQVVLKLQSFHEEKIRSREKADEFFSQFHQRYKPKTLALLFSIVTCATGRAFGLKVEAPNLVKNDAEQRKLDVAFIGAQYMLKMENGWSVSVANDMIIQVGGSNFYLRKLPMVVRRVICLQLLSIWEIRVALMIGVKRAGEHLILQDGCVNFFQKIVKSENLNANVHVLSYYWCGDLIKSVFSSGGLAELDVLANEFTFKESISTGDIAKKVEFPIDKVQPFKENLKN
ncbi:hypothetical protein C1H46_040874 [Malus baccata]|uniref:Uncharacterized protein n=1 Tax=Malus baccata TaxID=106549 RepID=A0A540KHA0_MALBA|nr:hypothetical protein C1H46_040874 [Malus baccata]